MTHAERDVVPGTIHLVDMQTTDHSKKHDIVLNPRPSTDPEDPLNWSKKRKWWAISQAYIYILGIGMSTTVQYSILTNIGEATNISIADINTGTGLVSGFLTLSVCHRTHSFNSSFCSQVRAALLSTVSHHTYILGRLGLLALAACRTYLWTTGSVHPQQSVGHWTDGMDSVYIFQRRMVGPPQPARSHCSPR